jgi:hypothetical protein
MGLRVRLDIAIADTPAGQAEIAPGHAFEVGRHGSGCRIDDHLLSRRHFVLETADDQLFLEDLGSANGTFLNGEQIVGRVAVADGDRIEAGKSAFAVHISALEPQRIGETGWLVTEIPGGWQLVPHLGFQRQEGELIASVICAQERIQPGQSLADYAETQFKALGGVAAELVAKRFDPGEIGGDESGAAALLAYRYGGRAVCQYQYYVSVSGDVGIVTWTKTAPASPSDIEEFRHLIGHLSFAAGDSGRA